MEAASSTLTGILKCRTINLVIVPQEGSEKGDSEGFCDSSAVGYPT
jgi:hypothetical protein